VICHVAEQLLFWMVHVMQLYAEPLLEQGHKRIDISVGMLLEKLQHQEGKRA